MKVTTVILLNRVDDQHCARHEKAIRATALAPHATRVMF